MRTRRVTRAEIPSPIPTLVQVAAALGALTGNAHAHAKDAGAPSASCSRDQALALANDGKDIEARALLESCAASAACKEAARDACKQLASELVARIPTVVFEMGDVPPDECNRVRVFVDDVLVQDHIDGREIAINPGRHTIRFEGPHEPASDIVLIREGEHRVLRAPTRAIAQQLGGVPPEVGGAYDHRGCCGGTGAATRATREESRDALSSALAAAVLLVRRRRSRPTDVDR